MRVVVFRTAMIGGGLSYDVMVPVSDVPNYNGTRYTTVIQGSFSDKRDHYVRYDDATLPEEHFAMPLGWARYDHRMAHEQKAKREMLDIAEHAFPELAKIRAQTDKIPTLWVYGLLPEETSAVVKLKLPLKGR